MPISLQHISKVRGRDQNLEAKAEGSRGQSEAEARVYEAEAKILASRPFWPRGFNISGFAIIKTGTS